MESLKERIYSKSPHFIQNCIVSIYNILAYKKRYSKNYSLFLKEYNINDNLSRLELEKIQIDKYENFIKNVMKKSTYYSTILKDVKEPHKLKNIKNLPILSKEVLRSNLNDVYTIGKTNSIISKTGGTTGKSLEVRYLFKDVEERFAVLDNFRNKLGYKLGKRTAWFSGKNLLTKNDINKNRFWKTDFYYKVRYYSTFHIHTKYLDFYIKNLIKFKPEFMVGFPSTMYEIAKYGIENNVDFPSGIIKAIFPTAETVTKEIRETLESYFNTNLYNQYASSEGAPFILECSNKKLHLELQSGVFEVLDDENNPVSKGKLVITSFNTNGTPLIRYDIGDQIELCPKSETCNCGNNNPLVKEILGRMTDYIYSEEIGKINLGNISNCLKGVNGIIRFQVQQHVKNTILLLIEKDKYIYTKKDEMMFLKNLRDRVGSKINIEINYVNEILVEKSGKFRLIKNTLNSKQ